MALRDDLNNTEKMAEVVCNALRKHEKELDMLICRLENNKNSLTSGLTKLNFGLEKIAQKIDELNEQFEQIAQLGFLMISQDRLCEFGNQ